MGSRANLGKPLSGTLNSPMLFPTLAFALFFVAVFAVYWLTRPFGAVWKWLMLGFSFYFYGYWNWRFVFLLAAAIVINWVAADRAQAARRLAQHVAARWWVRGGVTANLAILGTFKYFDFFSVELSNLLARIGIEGSLPVLEYTLPVGISFFTFQAMSYVIDVGRGQIETMEPLDFAVYLSFFPQLVAGPIVRASEFGPQLARQPDPRYVPSAEAFRLILLGLFKKVVISSYLANEIVDDVFANPEAHSGVEVAVGVYAYAVQIYADFSGYTDIAIGVALLLGFRFPQNFDAPYRSLSIREFWRRWHMTLSRWLRDYLYIPLGGSRGGRLFTFRNLMLTMLLGGLWHGATWNFVIWGGIHGVALVVERVVSTWWHSRGNRPNQPSPVGDTARWLLTFHIVCFGWVFFRADGLDKAWDVLSQLSNFSTSAGVISPLLLLVVFGALAAQFTPVVVREVFDLAASRASWLVQAVGLAIIIVTIDALGPSGVAPFIYFQF